jgi:hypothetical protein
LPFLGLTIHFLKSLLQEVQGKTIAIPWEAIRLARMLRCCWHRLTMREETDGRLTHPTQVRRTELIVGGE